MKTLKLFFLSASLLASICVASAQKYRYVDCSTLNIIGKVIRTERPYDRVDTARYKGLNKNESYLGRCPAGLAIAFRTDSKAIYVKEKTGYFENFDNSTGIAQRGYDLYAIKDGKYIWVAAGANKVEKIGSELKLIGNLDPGVKEFILYLPLYTELLSLELGVDDDSFIEPLDNPFRNRIAVYGSSFTQGAATTRPGMSYPQKLSRRTGLHFLNFGMDGNCKMQPQHADMLHDADVDAFLFDTFSNGPISNFENRLFPFIERIQEAHPGKPIIFQQTLMFETFNLKSKGRKSQQERMDTAERLVHEAMKKYKDIYFIKQDARKEGYDTVVDGIHPNDVGYDAWVDSIEKPVLRILRRYGIK